MIQIYYVQNVDDTTETVPFTTREAARNWAVLEWEHIEEMDSAECSISFRPATNSDIANLRTSGSDYTTENVELLVVDGNPGHPEYKDDGYWFIHTVTVYENTDEATEEVFGG
jgi:hypothetical protein